MGESDHREDPQAENPDAEEPRGDELGDEPGEEDDTSPGEPPPRESDGWASDASI